MVALVGYTGFVGSNLYARARNRIKGVYNSQNIQRAYGLEPEVLIYAGVRAEKYLANSAPECDLEMILEAEKNISAINPQKLVLISTIDVYQNPVEVDETDSVLLGKKGGTGNGIQPYGLNRYYLEAWARKHYPDALIVRLPGLYGYHIKKNFIYDYINVIPYMLKKEKYQELKVLEKTDDAIMLDACYEAVENGFYRCKKLDKDKKELLQKKFKKLGFTALNFTDSRSTFQFYSLGRLWDDIQIALNEGITLLNVATEPVTAAELYKALTGEVFKNELKETPAKYDFRTTYASKFGGKAGYICSKEEILADIKLFVKHMITEGSVLSN
ncbi:MAG: NAD(P)-dependent oxidoreductase [Lachnospiraceae bacterium]|nr:NAD(P)-dependent oxidoreductase [Lachnospiraceae bacterium]